MKLTARNTHKEHYINVDARRFSVDGNMLKISYVSHDVTIDITTGKGNLDSYRTVPFLCHMTQLHLDTSKWWI